MKNLYIDIYEIEEMLGEYYDFQFVTDEQWKEIDRLVCEECNRRGISPTDDYEAYAAVCDGAVGKVLA